MPEATYATLTPPTERIVRALVVDDEASIRGPLGLCLETLGHQVVEAATVDDALREIAQSHFDVALLDIRLGTANGLDLIPRLLAAQPHLKIIVITAFGSVDFALRAMARGATDFLCKPFTPEQVAAIVSKAMDLRNLESEVALTPDQRGTAGPEADFATTCQALQSAIITARQAAPSEVPILLVGEVGTGKAVLARAIHGWGKRPESRFVSLDCAARSAAFVELSLFGDAVSADQVVTADKPALLETVGDGTLLLRNVDALSPRCQERLAHMIDTREYESAGKPGAQKLQARLVATTTGGTELSAPLAHSLDRIRLVLPPLRERRDDIPLLAQRYLAAARQKYHKQILGISVEATDHLVAYDWPGNLRELHQIIDDVVRQIDAPYIELKHLPAGFAKTIVRTRPRAGDPVSLKDLEIAHIRATIENTPSLQAAADVLGLDLQALYRRRKQYGIE